MAVTDNDLLNSLWSQKWRPRNISDIVLTDEQRKNMEEYLSKNEIPHLLLYGPPGGGKTTLAKILVDYFIKSDMDLYAMNGSDSTGVENIRQNIISFLKSPPYLSKLKIIFIDEFDYISGNAQAILRNVMDTYCENARFICTCNYLSKLMDPLVSRFTSYEMKTLSKEYVVSFIEKILKAEEVEYDQNSVDLVVTAGLPDVRKILNTIQKNVTDKKLKKIDLNTVVSNEKKIIGLIIQIAEDCGTPRRDATINNNIPQIMQIVGDSLDYRSMYQTLFFHEKLPLWFKIKVNQYMNNMQYCVVPSAHLMACIYDGIQAGMVYHSMISKK